jgi:hypothetical protein
MSCYTEYSTISGYLESQTDLLSRILAIDAIITTSILLLADTAGGAGGNIAYYEMDDQQIRVKTGYRSLQDVSAGIDALTKIKNRFVNQYNGRASVLQDRSTFGSGRW